MLYLNRVISMKPLQWCNVCFLTSVWFLNRWLRSNHRF